MQKILILVASLRLSSKGHVANWKEERTVFPEEGSAWEEVYKWYACKFSRGEERVEPEVHREPYSRRN